MLILALQFSMEKNTIQENLQVYVKQEETNYEKFRRFFCDYLGSSKYSYIESGQSFWAGYSVIIVDNAIEGIMHDNQIDEKFKSMGILVKYK